MVNVSIEIAFKTFRSGGKGGQHVNKVETAAEGSFNVPASVLLSAAQKELLLLKLSNRINSEGFLQVRSQTHRTQLANKEEVIKKMTALMEAALKKKKARIATKPSKKAKENRIETKKRKSDTKQHRQKIRHDR
ncbi:MAG: alternative ribosome rescue aminoacyl-tRNA hydrolase ArfB [Chitinophagaceae bacterium]